MKRTPENEVDARVLFEAGAARAGEGRFDEAIDLYIAGLRIEPGDVEGYEQLLDVAKMRKLANGRPLDLFTRLRGRWRCRSDPIERLLLAAATIARDPFNLDEMIAFVNCARRASASHAGLTEVAARMEQEFRRMMRAGDE